MSHLRSRWQEHLPIIAVLVRVSAPVCWCAAALLACQVHFGHGTGLGFAVPARACRKRRGTPYITDTKWPWTLCK